MRPCASCGKPFEGVRSTARYCSGACRKRAQRGAKVSQIRPDVTEAGETGLVAAVKRELTEADRLETALGQATVRLAERIDSGADTGSAVASLTRELRATLEAATAGARVAASPLAQMRDELAERRRARSAG